MCGLMQRLRLHPCRTEGMLYRLSIKHLHQTRMNVFLFYTYHAPCFSHVSQCHGLSCLVVPDYMRIEPSAIHPSTNADPVLQAAKYRQTWSKWP